MSVNPYSNVYVADIDAEMYYDDMTELDFAKGRGYQELVKVLRDHGARK